MFQVLSQDTTLVRVSGPEVDHRGDSVANYPIILQLSAALWDRHSLETTIEVLCALTGQVTSIPLKVMLLGSKDDQPRTCKNNQAKILKISNFCL